jgi:hypothetical protein
MSLALLSCHALYDATEALPVSLANSPYHKVFVFSWLPRPEAVVNVIRPPRIPNLEDDRPVLL